MPRRKSFFAALCNNAAPDLAANTPQAAARLTMRDLLALLSLMSALSMIAHRPFATVAVAHNSLEDNVGLRLTAPPMSRSRA